MAVLGVPRSYDTDNNMSKLEAKSDAAQKNADAATQKGDRVEAASMIDSEDSGSVSVNWSEPKDRSAAPKPKESIRPPRSPLQRATSQRNGKRSPGPTTAAGKAISSRNAIKHGLLSTRLTQMNDQNAKDFADLLAVLQENLKAVGVLEEILVEKIAYEYFRMSAAAQHYRDAALYVVNASGGGPTNLLRYDSMINRQLFQAMKELERLQRLRRDNEVQATPSQKKKQG